MSFQTPITIRDALDRIHRHDFVLPAIQREFVWRPEPIVGGFGEAWPAVGPKQRKAWVKRAKPGREDALRREIRQLRKLKHAHIVELLDADAGASPWLVVADCGETLRARVAAGALSFVELLSWLDPIAKALDYAHGQKVIHHDVNTGNIARNGRGHVRLLDFGTTADMMTGVNTVGATTEVATTAVGFHRGFVAPELLIGQPARKGSDQYSLAAVGLAALVGAPDGGVSLADAAGLLSTAQRAVVQKALSLSPRDRFATCGAFVGTLRRARA